MAQDHINVKSVCVHRYMLVLIEANLGSSSKHTLNKSRKPLHPNAFYLPFKGGDPRCNTCMIIVSGML